MAFLDFVVALVVRGGTVYDVRRKRRRFVVRFRKGNAEFMSQFLIHGGKPLPVSYTHLTLPTIYSV